MYYTSEYGFIKKRFYNLTNLKEMKNPKSENDSLL